MNTEQFEGHTPGPWEVKLCWTDAYMVVDSHEVICSLTGNKDSENRKEWAELIAAAPDLLAAYKQKAQLADALWNFIEYFCPDMLHEATDCWNSNYGEYREIED
jgi:hypothetical protein